MKKFLLGAFITLIVVMIVTICSFSLYFNYKTRDIELDIERLEKAKTSVFLDKEGIVMNEDNYLDYDKIPSNLINAFVAVEDKRFFQHNGIDVKRMFGALYHNILHGNRGQGASTITQQLIKNTHLSSQKTIDRKLKEIKLALVLEKSMSKQDIIEKYLNTIYFGSGLYGIKDASMRIFGKKVDDLTVSECATLAGIVKAPTYYSPLNDMSRSLTRRNVVLRLMFENGYIGESVYEEAKNSDITINNSTIHSNISSYYEKQALYEASYLLGVPVSEIVSSNLRIATYYDSNVQNSIIDSIIVSKEMIGDNDVISMVSSNVDSGISGYYSNIETNIYAFRRQVGSTMKPLAVYLPSLEYGLISPATRVDDVPIDINGYTPNNYNGVYRGAISVRDAVMYSSNVVAVSLLDKLTIESAKEFLSSMDINIRDNGLALALGGLVDGITPIELISAYNSIPNGGNYAKCAFIDHIIDKDGNVIYRRNSTRKSIFSEASAYLMTDILKDTAKHGTARKLGVLPYDVASKTGTVASVDDNSRNSDAYNLSFTTQNTQFAWFGGDLASNIQGGSYPTILAREIYSRMYANNCPTSFKMPDSVQQLAFDKDIYNKNGDIVLTNNETNALYDIFDKRYLPRESVVNANDIVVKCENDTITIKNATNCTIKLAKCNLFGRESMIKEIYNADESVLLPIEHDLFARYIVEIYYGDQLLLKETFS